MIVTGMRHLDRRARRVWGAWRPGALVGLALIAMASEATAGLGAEPPSPQVPATVAAPTLTGPPAVGQTVSCSTGTWSGSPNRFGFVWLRDGKPIAGQTGSTYLLQASDAGHSISCRVTASVEAGSYTIPGLPTGRYFVSFSAGYPRSPLYAGNLETTYFRQEFASSEANRVSVFAGAVTSGIDAVMPTGGEITGTVRDAGTHGGVSGVDVCAEGEEGGRQESCAETNSAGQYTLTGLASGAYRVWFTYGSPLGAEWSWTEWYSGRATGAAADPVTVAAGGVTSGIDVEMATGAIAGTVRAAAGGSPAAGVEVCAGSVGAASRTGGCVRTDAEGRYKIAGLSTGAYSVRFSRQSDQDGNYVSQYYDDAASDANVTDVTVTPGVTATGVDAELQTGGRISGAVTSASTHAPLGEVGVCVLFNGSGSGPCTKTNDAGDYSLEGLPSGSYGVEFYGSGPYLVQYFDGKASEPEATPITVTAGATTGGIDAELQRGGDITGVVTDASSSAPVAGMTVCAEAGSPVATRCGESGPGGLYAIEGLAAGSYVVRFIREAESETDYLGQVFDGQTSSGAATRVQVTPGGSTGGIDAGLLEGGEITGRVTSSAGAGVAGATVCAQLAEPIGESILNRWWGGGSFECTVTSPPGGSAAATSNALSIPPDSHSRFELVKARFDRRTGMLDFFFDLESAGRLRWGLSVERTDVDFRGHSATRSGGQVAFTGVAPTAARRRQGACKRGYVRRHGHCQVELVALSDGARRLRAGHAELKIRPDPPALRALRSHRALHVRGRFSFQSSLGGPPAAHAVTLKVR